jgi:hypothetical protein
LTEDAVFAAIASYEAAVECLNATVDRLDDQKLEQCGRAYQTALDRMLSTAPITRAGCVALIEAYLASLRDDLGPDEEKLLQLLAAVIPHHTRGKDLLACNGALASRCGLAIITANFGDIHLVALNVALNLRVAPHAFSRYRH